MGSSEIEELDARSYGTTFVTEEYVRAAEHLGFSVDELDPNRQLSWWEKLLGKAREAGGPQAQALDARVRATVSLLVSSQNDDGGWSWTGRGGGSHGW